MATTTPDADETALRRAKRPRSILAGPYGHPFHSLLITIPIGAWTASLVFDILAAVTDDPEAFATGAAWLIVIGLAGAALAIITGLLDYSVLTRGTKAHATATAHMVINAVVSVMFIVNAVVRFNDLEPGGGFNPGLILTIVAMLLLGISGFLGGELAYRFGVRVADESTQDEGHSVARAR